MYPLFDEDCELVAWVEPGEQIYDTDMNWVAYILNNHAWSAETGNWLGPVHGLICLNQNGQVIAWNPKEHVAGTARPPRPARAPRSPRPPRPARPSRPARPARPAHPVGGWANESFIDWLAS